LCLCFRLNQGRREKTAERWILCEDNERLGNGGSGTLTMGLRKGRGRQKKREEKFHFHVSPSLRDWGARATLSYRSWSVAEALADTSLAFHAAMPPQSVSHIVSHE
jgi:hypothetical protein